MRKASPELEAFIDELIRRAAEKGYHPTEFMTMRRDYKTIGAISRLVRQPELQSGFKRLESLGLLDWTIEAAVERFPHEFSRDDIECAAFRLRQAREKISLR